MRFLLDTSTFIWSVQSPERLSKRAYATLNAEGNIREISTISISELAIKQSIGKLQFPKDAVLQGIEDMLLRVLPFSAEHALQMFALPLHHADPFDRQIIAQAIAENIPIVTSDAKFKLYENIEVLW